MILKSMEWNSSTLQERAVGSHLDHDGASYYIQQYWATIALIHPETITVCCGLKRLWPQTEEQADVSE